MGFLSYLISMSFTYSKWAFTLEDFIWLVIIQLFVFLKELVGFIKFLLYKNGPETLYAFFSEMQKYAHLKVGIEGFYC